jgi:UrcA family protein
MGSKMKHFAITTIALTAVFSAAAFAAPASVRVQGTAPDSSGGFKVQAMTVQYDDSDVATSEGASALLGRISQAAEAVCTVRPVRAATTGLVERCRNDAVKYAVAAVNAPALTQAAAPK